MAEDAAQVITGMRACPSARVRSRVGAGRAQSAGSQHAAAIEPAKKKIIYRTVRSDKKFQ